MKTVASRPARSRVRSIARSEARYLIRLDDACETFDLEKWQALKNLFDRLSIKPIVAVIPENRDESLLYSSPMQGFWTLLRSWQAHGWAMALHGHRHLYHSVDRRRLIFPFYGRSEFAGLDEKTQSQMLEDGLAIFSREGVEPLAWIAPSHSFDQTTLEALENTTGIRVISDGIALNPYRHGAFTFVPQQLWWPKPKRRGTWTICLHPNSMSWDEISALETAIAAPFFKDRFIDLQTALKNVSPPGPQDWLFAQLFWLKWRLRTVRS